MNRRYKAAHIPVVEIVEVVDVCKSGGNVGAKTVELGNFIVAGVKPAAAVEPGGVDTVERRPVG